MYLLYFSTKEDAINAVNSAAVAGGLKVAYGHQDTRDRDVHAQQGGHPLECTDSSGGDLDFEAEPIFYYE